MDNKGAKILGYREYAKDYEIEHVQQPGKRRAKAVRIYVGPYFRFRKSPEVIRKRRWQYLLLECLAALALLIPMLTDCRFTRIWYVQVPSVAVWIPWLLASGSVWRLWTAGEKVDREHYDLLHDRMRGATFFIMGLSGISSLGAVAAMVDAAPAAADIAVSFCYLGALACGAAMFVMAKDLEMYPVENPEKPQSKK